MRQTPPCVVSDGMSLCGRILHGARVEHIVQPQGRWHWTAIALMLPLASCIVDKKIDDDSTGLLMFDLTPSSSLRPGLRFDVAFQAVDAASSGVADQKLELVITDLSRLTFSDEPLVPHRVVSTERRIRANGVLLVGAAVVNLTVPSRATPGMVTLVGSLEGRRGVEAKTRWVTFTVTREEAESPDSGTTDGGRSLDPGPDKDDESVDPSPDGGSTDESSASNVGEDE